jgi:acyl-CoA thioester hydrolase
MSRSQGAPLEVTLHLPVKTYDIDFAAVVSNIVYIRWLEDLRLEMLNHYFPLNEQLKNNIAPIVVQTKINYKQPIIIFDAPQGRIWAKLMEHVRWTVGAEIVVQEKVAAIAEQVGIFIDLQSFKPIRIPKALAEIYRGCVL